MNTDEKISIPSDAELVFDGVRSKVYQWNQKMYDGSTARFERVKFMDGAFVIPILANGNILLTKQEQPARPSFLSLPGGGIDGGENPLDAAKRELLEETGAKSDNWKQWMEFYGTVNTVTNVYYFIARDCKIIQNIIPDGGEKIELFEVTFDEFLALSSNKKFHHHWNLLPELYEARLSNERYQELYTLFYK